MQKDVLTKSDYAKRLGVSEKSVQRLINQHGMPAVRIGNRLRVFTADADRFLRLKFPAMKKLPIIFFALLGLACSVWAQPGQTPFPATTDSPFWIRAEKLFGTLPASTLPSSLSVTGITTSSLVVTGGVSTASVAWSGPTNTLPLNFWRQHYTTFTPVRVTGFTGKTGTNVQSFLLVIVNSASTNVTFTADAGIADLNYGGNTITITNGTELIWSGEYDPFVTRTNAVGRVAP